MGEVNLWFQLSYQRTNVHITKQPTQLTSIVVLEVRLQAMDGTDLEPAVALLAPTFACHAILAQGIEDRPDMDLTYTGATPLVFIGLILLRIRP